MEFISSINDAVNSFVWGAPAIIMIMAVGLFLTFKLKGIQFRNLGFMIKKTYVEAFTKKEETESRGEGQITSFQAAMAAVSAVVGSGNTAGVALWSSAAPALCSGRSLPLRSARRPSMLKFSSASSTVRRTARATLSAARCTMWRRPPAGSGWPRSWAF